VLHGVGLLQLLLALWVLVVQEALVAVTHAMETLLLAVVHKALVVQQF
jgi:hypothetical protein